MATEKRLIDANAFKKALRTDKGADAVGHSIGRLLKIDAIIEEQPTIDAVEVVHGRWIIVETLLEDEGCCRLMCSVCGRSVSHVENPQKAIEYRPYCHCGAKMDGDGNG